MVNILLATSTDHYVDYYCFKLKLLATTSDDIHTLIKAEHSECEYYLLKNDGVVQGVAKFINNNYHAQVELIVDRQDRKNYLELQLVNHIIAVCQYKKSKLLTIKSYKQQKFYYELGFQLVKVKNGECLFRLVFDDKSFPNSVNK